MFRRDRNVLFFIILGFSSMFVLVSTGQIDTIFSYFLLGLTLGSFVLALVASDMTEFEKKPKGENKK